MTRALASAAVLFAGAALARLSRAESATPPARTREPAGS